MFRKFEPIRRMIISRDTGLINEYFTITKGQLIDLVHFTTLGEMDNDQKETFPVHPDDNNEEVIWVTREDVSKYKSGIIEI